MVMMIPVCARKCISTFFFLEEEILAYRVGFLRKALPQLICHFREWAPTNPPPGASHSNYGTKKLFGRGGGGKGGLVRKRVRLEKTTPTQSFYKYLHSQSTTLAGAGYIRKEGRKPRGREKKLEEQGEEGRGPFFLEQKGNPNKIQTLFPTCGPTCYFFNKTDQKKKKRNYFILESTFEGKKGMLPSQNHLLKRKRGCFHPRINFWRKKGMFPSYNELLSLAY